MSDRSIHSITQANINRLSPRLITRDVGEAQLGEDIDPFIIVSLYDMTGPTFPPHPHAGFSVATYILPESAIGFINQDSIGHRNRIAPGSLHWTTAGSGVLHEEQPERPGAIARGFQIWIDLPKQDRHIAPDARHLAADNVPTLIKDGATIRAVLSASNGLTSPLTVPTPVRLIDVTLEPDAAFVQTLDENENAFIVMLGGEAHMGEAIARTDDIIRTKAGGKALRINAGAVGARFILFAGEPLRQSRAQRGPFIASDTSELNGFMNAYAAGLFGQLTPFAQQSPQPKSISEA
ncbi:hypothetical protein NIES2100_01730 [Calothrix sp. NIES-2100]|uniref:pirin family protein n=1 Tax=Calothrix sp. NIES-2100 TaxID=1954172 RepID=UPI000B5E51CA|nr:hypothetical protein NIES2100_01730 [Calothrix sp. NIES-2100]